MEGLGWVTLAGGGGYMTYEFLKALAGKRPDSDGKVTLTEAKAWSQFGEGDLSVNVNSIDFSGVSISDFNSGGIAHINLKSNDHYFRNSGDGLVYGNLTLNLNRDGTGFTVSPDTYNFDPRWENMNEFGRNLKTLAGGILNSVTFYGPIPVIRMGKSYNFIFNGTYYFKSKNK